MAACGVLESGYCSRACQRGYCPSRLARPGAPVTARTADVWTASGGTLIDCAACNGRGLRGEAICGGCSGAGKQRV
jgi:hypothetical protein